MAYSQKKEETLLSFSIILVSGKQMQALFTELEAAVIIHQTDNNNLGYYIALTRAMLPLI